LAVEVKIITDFEADKWAMNIGYEHAVLPTTVRTL
jgi:hypothetical protein